MYMATGCETVALLNSATTRHCKRIETVYPSRVCGRRVRRDQSHARWRARAELGARAWRRYGRDQGHTTGAVGGFAGGAEFHDTKGAAACTDVVTDSNPDLTFNCDGADVHVFGVDHSTSSPLVAEYVLRTKPEVLVMETGADDYFSAEVGRRAEYDETLLMSSPGPGGNWMVIFTRMAWQLRQEGFPEVRTSGLWGSLCEQLTTEQLVYVAAFTAGIPILYGDRPKDISYKRLLYSSTLEDLDSAFAAKSAANYRETLSRLGAVDGKS
eukprot:CAMPEP_0118947986 /NCGR_PEP_ID=MMETSP1169-20130426/47033_1 /TAXON_ID=36882 /ORGANISM="Pyramimonas obovata, Strain CCMP722" /LENGTH=268 /DNA_ID=CAMNT_0006894313 /DNA_START=68 /DNA_END=870 /DNA_ORIENTATION=-